MLVEEPDLLARLRAGEQAAFVTIVRGWSPAMLRVARSHVRTDATAEEIVQEAWISVIRALPGFEGRAMLRTWVFRILVNLARRRGRVETRTMPELAAGLRARPVPGRRRSLPRTLAGRRRAQPLGSGARGAVRRVP